MKLYHGSYTEITVIDLKKSKPYKDFGKAFYLTKYYEQAKIWANRLGREYKREGMVTEFEFDEYAYEDEDLKVLKFAGYDEQWLDFIVFNRSKRNPAHDYDIVEGPVADDKVQNRIADYLSGLIDKTDFLEELKWHEDTHQICFCTVASLVFLKHTDQKRVSLLSHIGEPVVEKLMLDHGFDEQTASDKFFSSGTFAHLADETTALYQKPWQEIYEMLKSELKM